MILHDFTSLAYLKVQSRNYGDDGDVEYNENRLAVWMRNKSDELYDS